MNLRRRFLINPSSGRRSGSEEFVRELSAFFRARTGEFDAVVSRGHQHLVESAREALLQGIEQLVAVGGDGTVNAVANGFFDAGKPLRPDSCLAVARTGTGSDYYKGLTSGRSVDWREIVVNPEIRAVDLGRIRILGPEPTETLFANMASVGASADVARKKEQLPSWVPGALQYLIPTVLEIPRLRAHSLKLTLDEKVVETQALDVAVSKGRYAGGGMRFGAKVALDDGLFEVTLFEKMHAAEILTSLHHLYTGDFSSNRGIRKFQVRKLRIESSEPVALEFDGEASGSTPVEFEVLPQALRLCFPKPSA